MTVPSTVHSTAPATNPSHVPSTVYSTMGTAVLPATPVVPDHPHPYWTQARVHRALGTGPRANVPFRGISTDSRSVQKGDLFVALAGDRYDAHDFLSDACASGAAAVVVNDAMKAAHLGVPVYVVPDTLIALGQLASAWRTAWGRTVIAVAGSNGKTTTKDLIRAALGGALRVHATAGNFNNLIGVPLTLLAIPADCDVAVVEVGTNMPGEIAVLRAMVQPDMAVLTSIGEEHLEGLGDLAGVLREESDILDEVSLAVVPLAHPEVAPIAARRARAVMSAGLSVTEGAAVDAFTPTEWGLDEEGRPWLVVDGVRCALPVRGAHQAANAMLAFAVARACGVSTSVAAQGMAAMPVPAMRGVWDVVGDAVIINDAYNANPASMRAALELLSHVGAGRQRVAILGSMRELGAQSDAQHHEVLQAALATSANVIAVVGDFARVLNGADGAHSDGPPYDARIIAAADVDELWTLLEPRLDRRAVILLKASRGMKLERIVPLLTTWATAS